MLENSSPSSVFCKSPQSEFHRLCFEIDLEEAEISPYPPVVPVNAGQSALQYEGLSLPEVVAGVVGDADVEREDGTEAEEEGEEGRHDGLHCWLLSGPTLSHTPVSQQGRADKNIGHFILYNLFLIGNPSLSQCQ